MREFDFVTALTLALEGAALLFAPHLSVRRFFFTVTAPPGFQEMNPARAILRRYYAMVGAALALSFLIFWLLAAGSPGLAAVLPSTGLLAAGVFAFLSARNRVIPYAAPSSPVREAELAPIDDGFPRWTLLALPPFVFPLCAAVYLRSHWNEIPAHFPVHWNAAGGPDRWVEKAPHAVYGPLIFGAGVMILLLLIGVATHFGARRAAQRTPMLAILTAVEYCVGFTFALVGLMPVWHVSPMFAIAPTLLFVVALSVWVYRFQNVPGRTVEATPDNRWHGGMIYYNPQDPAVFVQKRIGLGYTLNFGNRLAWAILICLIAAVVGIMFALP